MQPHKIATWSEVQDREPVHALVSTVDLVVVRFDDNHSVLYGRCLHRGALMSDGRVDGDDLICGVHGWDYGFRTGISSYNNAERLTKFSSWIEDGDLFVDLDEIEAWEKDNPQPYDRDAYQGAYQDVHGTPDEPHVGLIRQLAAEGLDRLGHHGPTTAMGVPRDQVPAWDDLQFVTAQLAKRPLLDEVEVKTSVVIGPNAVKPLHCRVGLRTSPPPAESLDEAVALLAAAERPLIIVGAGARQDMDAIVGLAERLGAPVATTFKGKGQISDHHPLGCGVLGRSGTPIASWFMNESDLIVAFGASFANHTGISAYKPIVQVDNDPMALGRFHPVTVGVLGDVGVTARAIDSALPTPVASADRRPEVAERWEIWRAEKASRVADDRGAGLSSAAIFSALTAAVDPDAILSVDVGNNTYSFGRYFEVDQHTVLMSGYLGSIGFGFAAGMGAWAAKTGRQVVSVSGDGGFGQYAMELTTAVKYGMNITHVLVDNGELGKISKEQRSADLDVWQTSLHNPNFAMFAENCGALGIRVTDPAELPNALAQALAHDGPALVDIVADAALV